MRQTKKPSFDIWQQQSQKRAGFMGKVITISNQVGVITNPIYTEGPWTSFMFFSIRKYEMNKSDLLLVFPFTLWFFTHLLHSPGWQGKHHIPRCPVPLFPSSVLFPTWRDFLLTSGVMDVLYMKICRNWNRSNPVTGKSDSPIPPRLFEMAVGFATSA